MKLYLNKTVNIVMIISKKDTLDLFFNRLGMCCFYMYENKQIHYSISVIPVSDGLINEIKRK